MSAKKFRLLVVFLSFLFVSISLSSLYIFLPNSYQTIDNRLRDFFFVYRGSAPHSEDIIIVDIDEKSIAALGQWPWERKYISIMLDNLTQAGVGIIGLDIVFSENDKTSPHTVAQKLDLEDYSLLENYDEMLATSIANSPTITGYIFDFDYNTSQETPQIPAIFIEKGYKGVEFMPQPKGTLINIPIIQENTYSSGYLNNIPDPSGMVRSVPLVMKHDDSVYSSLAFEMIRIIYSASKVIIQYDDTGIDSLKVGEKIIPTDRFGRFFVNYKGPGKTYNYISAVDIIENNFNQSDFAGKVIIVGTSAHGIMDLRSTPLDNVMPGVEIHANVIDNILQDEMLTKLSWAEGLDILIIFILSFVMIMLISYIPLLLGITLFASIAYGIVYGFFTLLFEYHIIVNILFPILTFILSILTILGIKYIFEVRQKEMIKGKFSQKVSPQIMEDLIAQGTDHLHTRNKNVTIFFSDIRSFTTISEDLGSPEILVEFLNYYMTEMVETIVSRNGTIDKFIGDAIMAYWNAPGDVANHADKALQSTIEQISKREELSRYTQEKYGFELDYGIGLNTGDVTVGDIGSEGRSDYTVIGDAVNLASRLESLCKFYGVRIIISEFTKDELVEEYFFRELDWVKVKGKHEPVKIYEVLEDKYKTQHNLENFTRYEKALELFRNSYFHEALTIFEALNTQTPHKLYQLYIDRCNYLIDNKVTDFDGVFTFDFK